MNVTVKDSVFVAAPPEAVWDYSQDWSRRPEWDAAIVSATLEKEEPRTLLVKMAGSMTARIQYKLYDRPNRTSLAMTDFSSSLLKGGGGSWEYVGRDGGTEFRQTNTLVLGDGLFARLLRPIIAWRLARGTRKALAKAKTVLESQRLRAPQGGR